MQRTRRTRRIDTTSLMLLLLLGVVGFAFLLGLSLNSNPEKQALAVQEATEVLPLKVLSKQTGYIIWMLARVGLVVMAGYVVYYVIAIGRNWLDLRARQVQAKDGLYPIIEVQRGAFYDPNRALGEHPIITMGALAVQKQAAIRAEKIIVRQTDKVLPKGMDLQALPEVEAANLPDLVRLADVARNPSLENLVLGVGEQGTITASLFELMHVLAVGASGFGKSAFLRALVWQLAQVREPLDVVAIDINGSEFNTIRQWARLLYPVARTTPEAIATLQAVSGEIARRKGLYERYPQAHDLPSYNALANERLDPVVILTDEGTNLLNQAGIGDPLREVTQTARQYGVYLLLAGQSAKHSVIDTQTRDNFSTRLCFHTSPSSYRTVLGQSVDDVTRKGRAWAQLTGATLQKIQCPYVTREEVQRVLEVGTPQRVIDLEAVTPVTEADDKEQQIIALFNDGGLSDSKIARQVYGYSNARTVEKVKELRRRRQNDYVQA